MKIVCVDSFGREEIADKLVCENINKYYGIRVVDFLISKTQENSSNWYVLKDDDYKLWRGMEDLV